MRVFMQTGNPSGSGTAYGSAGTIEYADKENQRNPANDNQHVTEQGIRYRQYTPVYGIPAGETCSVRSARCPDRSDCSGTRNAGCHLFDQDGRSLSHFLPISLFSRRSGIPDGISRHAGCQIYEKGSPKGPLSPGRIRNTRPLYSHHI